MTRAPKLSALTTKQSLSAASECLNVGEAKTMQFAAEKAAIPAPKALGACAEEDCAYIAMEFLVGAALTNLWESWSSTLKKQAMEELKGRIDQLRRCEGSYIGAIGGAPCCDPMFVECSSRGPFETESDMNEELAAWHEKRNPGRYGNALRRALRADHRIVMPHGGIRMRSMLVKDGHIAGVADWEMAGFYPECWEFAIAIWGIDWKKDWGAYLQRHLPTCYDEHAMLMPIRDNIL